MKQSQIWGTHRGKVLENADPLRCGRLKVQVTAAYGKQAAQVLPWAWPKYGAPGTFYVPKIGESVYIEFLCTDGEPDPAHPVWTGTWGAIHEVPPEVAADSPENAQYYHIQKTPGGHRMVICDKPGEETISIQHKAGGSILFDSDGSVQIKGKFIYLN